MLKSKRTLTAITHRRAAFAPNKVVQISTNCSSRPTLRADTRNSIFNLFSKWTVFSERVTCLHQVLELVSSFISLSLSVPSHTHAIGLQCTTTPTSLHTGNQYKISTIFFQLKCYTTRCFINLQHIHAIGIIKKIMRTLAAKGKAEAVVDGLADEDLGAEVPEAVKICEQTLMILNRR